MSLAAVSNDPAMVNTRYEWTWQAGDKLQGVITVTSTRVIKPGSFNFAFDMAHQTSACRGKDRSSVLRYRWTEALGCGDGE